MDLKDSYRIVLPVFFVAWLIGGLAFKKLLFVWVRRLASKTESQIDDILVDAADKPLLLLIAISGLMVAHQFMMPGSFAQQITPFLPISLKVLTVLSIILFIDGVILGSVQAYSGKYEFLKISQGLLRGITHIVVFGLGLLIVLDSLGISITPIIASLGIGSLAVALALQPTLENLFAGFQIVFDQPIKPGQFIRLESGEEGYVEKVGWRSTWILQQPNNTIIIPNSHLVNSRVLNYHYPTMELAVPVDLGVHYSSDLEKVERVTVEVAEDILKRIPGGIPEFKPIVRFTKFDASSINFTAVLRAKEFADSALIRHEFIKSLTTRYAKEAIAFPYPVVALNTAQEKALFHFPSSS